MPTYCCAQSHQSPHPFQLAISHLTPPMQLSDPSQLATILAILRHLLQVPSIASAKPALFSLSLLVKLHSL